MPAAAPLRLVKRWRRYEARDNWTIIPKRTRGVYILYRKNSRQGYDVEYIGVAGIGDGKTGIHGRIKQHTKSVKKNWTHFSFFEVHDNIGGNEIRELESLFLAIFRHDSRVKLANKQKGSKTLSALKADSLWPELQDKAF